MSLGLLGRASWVALCHSDWCGSRGASSGNSGASTGGSWCSGEPKRLIFQGRASTESIIFGLWYGSGRLGGPNGSF